MLIDQLLHHGAGVVQLREVILKFWLLLELLKEGLGLAKLVKLVAGLLKKL